MEIDTKRFAQRPAQMTVTVTQPKWLWRWQVTKAQSINMELFLNGTMHKNTLWTQCIQPGINDTRKSVNILTILLGSLEKHELMGSELRELCQRQPCGRGVIGTHQPSLRSKELIKEELGIVISRSGGSSARLECLCYSKRKMNSSLDKLQGLVLDDSNSEYVRNLLSLSLSLSYYLQWQ